MTAAPWDQPPVVPAPQQRVDAEAHALAVSYRTLIQIAASTSPRSQQGTIGASELGHACARRLAYRLSGTPAVNDRDHLAAMLGTGWHHVMADFFTRLGSWLPGRFLVETPVTYRG